MPAVECFDFKYVWRFCGLPIWCSGKESACQCRNARDADLIPGLGRSPGRRNGTASISWWTKGSGRLQSRWLQRFKTQLSNGAQITTLGFCVLRGGLHVTLYNGELKAASKHWEYEMNHIFKQLCIKKRHEVLF